MSIDISRFTIRDLGPKKRLIAELSNFKTEQIMQPIYPAVAGLPQREGLTVQGRTGEVTYYVANVLRDREGDLEAYVLLPTRESIAAVPAAAKTEVVLVND